MEIKIKDTAFSHTDYSTLQKSKYFKWNRCAENKDVCFFTDHSLVNVLNSQDTKKIAWLIEPIAINPNSYDFIKKSEHLFDHILTYDSDLLAKNDKYKFYPHGGCWLNDDDKKIWNKNKFISIIASNKRQTFGHLLRHEIITKLKDKIDVYGNGYNKIENKIIGLKDYKFSIVVENSKQDDYFTEKIIDTILTGTVPLYWGTNNINKYFKNIPTFNTIDELIMLIDFYSKNEYSIDDIQYNFNEALKYVIPEDYIFENYKFLFK